MPFLLLSLLPITSLTSFHFFYAILPLSNRDYFFFLISIFHLYSPPGHIPNSQVTLFPYFLRFPASLLIFNNRCHSVHFNPHQKVIEIYDGSFACLYVLSVFFFSFFLLLHLSDLYLFHWMQPSIHENKFLQWNIVQSSLFMSITFLLNCIMIGNAKQHL